MSSVDLLSTFYYYFVFNMVSASLSNSLRKKLSPNLIYKVVEFVNSNASDALDKLRFLGVTKPDLLKDAVDLDIRIQTDKDNGIITIM